MEYSIAYSWRAIRNTLHKPHRDEQND